MNVVGRYGSTLWFVVAEALAPGLALFALLAWLTHVFLRDGFAHVRHHALAPGAGRIALPAVLRRDAWSCTCGVCTCFESIASRVRACCRRLLAPALLVA
jgi:hypothetical protein